MRNGSSTSSAKRRSTATPISPYMQHAPPPLVYRTAAAKRSHAPSIQHSAACYCPQCIASADAKRRQALIYAPSPYLEDLTKSLVMSQPRRKKLHLVAPHRYPAAASPYESLRDANRAARAQLRAQLQAELAERQLQRLWDMEAAAAAERCGVDLGTYATLLELQHRDIMPEDYDMLQQLDTNNKRQTVAKTTLETKFPAWRVPDDGRFPPSDDAAPAAPAVRRNLEGAFNGDDEADEDGGGGSDAAVALPPPPSSGIKDDERTCSICLERFVGGQLARTLACKHVFHADCIDEWLTTSSRMCPEDGLPVLTEAEAAACGECAQDDDADADADADAEDAHGYGGYDGVAGYGDDGYGQYGDADYGAEYGDAEYGGGAGYGSAEYGQAYEDAYTAEAEAALRRLQLAR